MEVRKFVRKPGKVKNFYDFNISNFYDFNIIYPDLY